MPTPLNVALPAVLLLAAIPVVALFLVRRGQLEPTPRASIKRLAALYALVALALMLAAVVDDLPMSLGLLGVILALFGLGVGLEPLYAFLYGHDWLETQPDVVRSDTARWQKVTLLAALLCLVAAVVLALALADVAVASRDACGMPRWALS